jgi:small-conductance mechanosensitive channel
MSKKAFTEKRNPGSLDFIESALNENSKDLKNFSERIDRINEKLTNLKTLEQNLNILQAQINALSNSLNSSIHQSRFQPSSTESYTRETSCTTFKSNPIIILKCKDWKEFQNLASEAKQVSITIKESERVFEVDVLKENQIIAYVGPIPEFHLLLKHWLSANLKVASDRIFEGTLS